jgi:hypothetical protein
LVFLLLLVGGLAWWAHRHLTRILVESVNRTYPGVTLSARTAAFSGPGELKLEAVQFRLAQDQSAALSVASAKVRFSWSELRQRYIREVVVESPQIVLTDALLKAFPSGESGDRGAPWRIGRLSISDGHALVDLASQPRLEGRFSVDVLEGSESQVRLNALRVRLRDQSAAAVSIAALSAKFTPDELRQGKIRELVLDSPHLVFSDALLALFPKSSADSGSSPAWSVEKISIEKGSASVDVGKLPRMRFDFAAHAADSSGPLSLDLNRVAVQLRQSESEVLSIVSAHAVVSPAELRAQKIREIAIEDPHVNLTDEALDLLQSLTGGPASSPPSAPWTLGRVSLKRGQAKVDLRGVPLADFGFTLQLANAVIAPDGADELQSLEITDLALRPRDKTLEPFLRIPAIRADFRIPELLRANRIARLRVEHPDFRYNTAFREMIASGEKHAAAKPPPTSPVAPAPPVTIAELRLVEGLVHLNDLGLGVPPIDFRVDTSFRELSLSPDAGAAGHELQTVELSQIAFASPLDPFFNVLKLDSLFIRFTLAGLWRRDIEAVEIVHPILAIGPDLFWYVDRVQENAAAPTPAAAAQAAGPGWTIHHFNATSGQLILALEGQRSLAVPMPFESHAENLDFRRLSDLRLKLAIDMPEQDYEYPGYELTLRGVRGRIEFSLPAEKRANNVVNTLHLREVRWKNFRSSDCFLDVTYDVRGVYGHLGGKAYSGIVNGEFDFLLGDDSPWNGWISGEHIDLKQITDILAPEKFSLSSPANFRVSVTARGKQFDSVIGDFKATRAGRLRIGKLDDLIHALPGDWSGLKRGLARIGLETLRDFAYDAAHGDFRFHGRSGSLHLDLRGPYGSRKLVVDVHDEAAAASPEIVASRP